MTIMTDSTASINSRKLIPESIRMTVNPNPFNASLSINYDLVTASDVSIEIYDIMGHQTAILVSEHQSAGTHISTWNAPEEATSGIYFVRLKAGDQTIVKRAILMK